jgi:hypothetical protein
MMLRAYDGSTTPAKSGGNVKTSPKRPGGNGIVVGNILSVHPTCRSMEKGLVGPLGPAKTEYMAWVMALMGYGGSYLSS